MEVDVDVFYSAAKDDGSDEDKRTLLRLLLSALFWPTAALLEHHHADGELQVLLDNCKGFLLEDGDGGWKKKAKIERQWIATELGNHYNQQELAKVPTKLIQRLFRIDEKQTMRLSVLRDYGKPRYDGRYRQRMGRGRFVSQETADHGQAGYVPIPDLCAGTDVQRLILGVINRSRFLRICPNKATGIPRLEFADVEPVPTDVFPVRMQSPHWGEP